MAGDDLARICICIKAIHEADRRGDFSIQTCIRRLRQRHAANKNEKGFAKGVKSSSCKMP